MASKKISDKPPVVRKSVRTATKRAADDREGPASNDAPPPKIRRGNVDDDLADPAAAKEYLVRNSMLPDDADTASARDVATALFHIAEAAGMPSDGRRMVRAAAYLVKSFDTMAVSEVIHDAAVTQTEYLAEETRNLSEHVREVLTAAATEQVRLVGEAAAAAIASVERASSKVTGLAIGPAEGPRAQSPYRDALMRSPSPTTQNRHSPAQRSSSPSKRRPQQEEQASDVRVQAREGVRARQFLIDFPPHSTMRTVTKQEALVLFNKALAAVSASTPGAAHRVRSVKILPNKGYLGEFLADAGAAWFHEKDNADRFIKALGGGAEWRPRTYSVIVFGVPISYDETSLTESRRVEALNILPQNSIQRTRWVVAKSRRQVGVARSPLILSLQSARVANRIAVIGHLSAWP